MITPYIYHFLPPPQYKLSSDKKFAYINPISKKKKIEEKEKPKTQLGNSKTPQKKSE
jgi:hypothetical protein